MNLKELRLRSELTTHKVAQQLQIVESTVRNWESGRTIPRLRLDQFQHLCKIYQCEFNELCAAFQKTQAQLEEKQVQLEDVQKQIEETQPYFKGRYNIASEPAPKYYTEADIISKLVLPKLQASGWDKTQILQELPIGKLFSEQPQIRHTLKYVDFMLRYTRDFALAIVEIKSGKHLISAGLNQAQELAKTLRLKFAYCTNGDEITEWDGITGKTRNIDVFPTPEELWKRFSYDLNFHEKYSQNPLLLPSYTAGEHSLPYAQQTAINLGIQSILQKKNRICLQLATGAGRTRVTFEICWKLWNARWNLDNEYRRPKILYLSDREALIDNAKDKIFAPFGQAIWKIKDKINRGRDIYFATCQSLASKELYKGFSPDFFDLIINDAERINQDTFLIHILSYFHKAIQVDMVNCREINFAFSFTTSSFEYKLENFRRDTMIIPILNIPEEVEDSNHKENSFNYLFANRKKNQKFYFHSKEVEIIDDTVYEIQEGNERKISFIDYVVENVRQLFYSYDEFRYNWAKAKKRKEIIDLLKERGIEFDKLASLTERGDADPFDLLCHITFSTPVLTSAERVCKIQAKQQKILNEFSPKAQAVLKDFLDAYANYGPNLFKIPDILKFPPIAKRGSLPEIISFFGNAENLRDAITQLQNLIYSV